MSGIAHLVVSVLVVYGALLPNLVRRRFLAAVVAAFAVVLLLVSGAHAVQDVRKSLASPPIWDARAFWLYGRAADVTHQPYDPRALQAAAVHLPRERGFTREVLDVGFIYPPPTVALVAPIGLFASPRSAAPLWYGVLCVALIAQIILLWRHFLREDGWIGLLASLLLVMLLPTTLSVLQMGQTLFIAEAFLLLFLGAQNPWRRGIWFALAAIVKPFLAVVFVAPLLRREWRVCTAIVATCLFATAAVLPLIGWRSVVSFFMQPPAARLPTFMWTEDANQSVIGWMVRTLHESPQLGTALHQPAYVLISLLLTALTLWRVIGARRDLDYCVTLLLALSLLVYPEGWWYYTTMLSIPICLIWSRRATIPYGSALAAVFTGMTFIFTYAEGTQFFAFLLTWIVLMLVPALVKMRLPSHLVLERA